MSNEKKFDMYFNDKKRENEWEIWNDQSYLLNGKKKHRNVGMYIIGATEFISSK